MRKSRPTRKISLFYFLVILVITSIILVVYINNIITVNSLSVSNNQLKDELRKSIEANEQLSAEIEQLSSYDKVKSRVQEKYNLSYKENQSDPNLHIVINKSQLK